MVVVASILGVPCCRICSIASVLGGLIGYYIGLFGGRPVFNWFFRKHPEQFEEVEKLYNKYGAIAVFFAGFTPIPYKVFTIASGVFKMNLLGFTLVSIAGRGLRFFIIAIALILFGEKIKDWVLLDYGLRINWLVEFHVDTDYRLLDKKELEDNKLVWNFRNDNNWKYLPSEYQIYPNESFPISLRLRIAFKIHELLCNTFGEKYLQFLTLVCIPASSAKKNDDRYKDFANILCDETRMENATSYIRYLNDGISKYDKNNNTGNAIPPTFSYKTELFRGKCILLVDDMIIEGKTMVRYKELFSNMGAHVIGGICIGINQELVKQGQQYIDQSLPLLNKIYEDRQRLHDEKIAEEKRKQAEKEAKEKREKEEQEKEEKEEIERKLKEIERKQKEFEEQKNNAPAVFSTKVKQWEPLRDGFHYTWLDYYYPVDIPNFEATRKEWDVRKLVWNFKNRDKKLKPEVHRLIASDVAWRIQECLNETFGEQYLQFLTLVCIPASTKEMYEVRYQDFSISLCRFTNMENVQVYNNIFD